MERKKLFGKRLLSFAVSAVMLAAATPLNAFALEKYDLWVGGVQVTSQNADDILFGGEASYDVITNALHLKGDITKHKIGSNYAIENKIDGLIISVDDDVTLGEAEEHKGGLYFFKNCSTSIGGSGKLTVNGSIEAYDNAKLSIRDSFIVINSPYIGIAIYGGHEDDTASTVNIYNSYICINAKWRAIGLEPGILAQNLELYDCGFVVPEGVSIKKDPSGWISTCDIDGVPVNNVIIDKNICDQTLVVNWHDNDNAGGIRPENLTAQLYAGTQKASGLLKLSSDNSWTVGKESLDIYKNGEKADYKWNIDTPEGYTLESTVTEGDITTVTFKAEGLGYIISFDANGGSGTMADVNVAAGDKLTLPECTFTPPEGKVFDKWIAGAPGDEVEITANSVITAIWKNAAHKHKAKKVEGKDPTCTEAGKKTYYVCEECGKLFEDKECTKEMTDPDEAIIPATGHDWGKWEVIKEPTETEDGKQKRVCKNCGETEFKVIPKLGENTDDKKSDDSKPDDKKSDDSKTDDKKSDDSKTDDKKSDDSKPDVTTPDEDTTGSEDKQTSGGEDGKDNGKETDKPADDYLLGDVNGDGKITVTDIAKAAAHVKGVKSLTDDEFRRADVNIDGSVNVVDISKIAAHVKGIKTIS